MAVPINEFVLAKLGLAIILRAVPFLFFQRMQETDEVCPLPSGDQDDRASL